jgi:predicted transposase YbfD/YdcC
MPDTLKGWGCQRGIAQKIKDKKARCILALKVNQGTRREDAELFANEQKVKNFSGTTVSRHRTADAGHRRIETGDTTVIHDIGWLQERTQWPSFKSVVMVESARETGGKIAREMRFYITSLALLASLTGPFIRGHWTVENSLHWIPGMVFRDDEYRVRTDHAPANLTTIKHMALNLIRRAPGKDSMRLRRKAATWDDDFLAAIISR